MNAAHHDLLFGLLTLQNGLIDQGQLVAAFQAWTRERVRPLAELLIARGDLDSEQRAGIEAMVALHLKKHGSDTERSLSAIPADRSTRESLARIGDPEIGATLGHVGSAHRSTEGGDVGDRTAAYSVGTATSDGQRFRVLRPHARGGLGAVFVALDSELHREVALKQILEKHADDPASRQRFVAEAEITGGLEHPGVVPVYGLGTDAGGHPYYAMRFIKGDSLKEAVERFHMDEALKKNPGGRSLELRKLLGRFTDVCNAIDYAHSRGVIHRDLKPANIIVGKHGETLVVDWGLAKAVGRADPSVGEQTIAPSSSGSSQTTLPGSALGTPAYMSPEQSRGELERLGPRSDVYSLGATLYCLLTGKPPFEGDDIGAMLRRVQEGQFPRPSQHDPALDQALEAVCLKAMATGAEGRYPTCRALAEDVERWMADEPVTAWREPFSRRARRWARRNRTAVTAAAAALLVALVGTAAVLAVQTRANANLQAANTDLALASAKVTRANNELAASNQRERARFELAQEAIRMFHTGVSEDLLLKQKEFGALRTRLLRGAQEFYRKLEGLLGGQADRDSRRALGKAYYEVGELTQQLDSMKDSLTMYQRALTLFEELAGEAPADADLGRDIVRSRAAVALTLLSVGRAGDALAAIGPAFAEAQLQASAYPADPGRRNALARIAHLHGELLLENSRVREGLLALEQATSIQEDLVKSNPSVVQFKTELAQTSDSFASRLDEAGRRPEALKVYRRARELGEELFRVNPADARIAHELVRTLGNMGIADNNDGRRHEALAAFDRAREVLEVMGNANPALLSVTRDRAWIDSLSADILIGTARDVEAIAVLERARNGRETLIKADTSVVRDQTQLVRINSQLAGIHTRAGRVSDARASYERAAAVSSMLADAHPGNNNFKSQLVAFYNELAKLDLAAGKPSEALLWSDKAMAIHRGMFEADRTQQGYLADGLRRHAIVLEKCGRPAAAVAAFRQAITALKGLASPGEIYDLACDQSLLSGVAANAGSCLTAAEGRAEAENAMKSLRRAVAAGWRNVDHMRADSDLDPLRGRPDFKLLMLDLAMPADPFVPRK